MNLPSFSIRPALLPWLIFASALLWFHPPFLADDYYWLWLPLKNPAMGWTEPQIFSRMPIATLEVIATLKSGLWEIMPRILLSLFFGIYCAAFSILLQTLFSQAGIKNAITPKAWLIPASIFILNPNNFEIHLWPTNSIHAIGALFIALAHRQKKIWISVCFALLGLMSYDSFSLLLLGYSGLLLAVTPSEKIKSEARRLAQVILISGFLWVGSKGLLGYITGQFNVFVVETSIPALWDHMKGAFRMLWLLHFYKEAWLLSSIYWVGVALLVFVAWSARVLPKGRLAGLLLIPTLMALPLSLNTFEAPRAFFGPQILHALTFAFIAITVLANPRVSPAFKYAPLALIGLAYGTQWGLILDIKHKNYLSLQRDQTALTQRMENCPTPCTLKVSRPGRNLRGDYVLPEFVWTYYYERLALLHFPKKEIHFEIEAN